MVNHDGNRTPIGKSTDPRKRMGVYKTLEDVPENRRLGTYRGTNLDGDTIDEWRSARYEDPSDLTVRRISTFKDRWQEHMEERGKNAAAADPEDVDAFCEALLDRVTMDTAYQSYWTYLEHYYKWMMWNIEYPHRYSPVLMAAAEYPSAGKLWKYKVERARP